MKGRGVPVADDKPKPSLIDYLEECCTADPSPEAVRAMREAFGELKGPSRMYLEYRRQQSDEARWN